MSITIYHNPNCGTSRNVLAIIREFYGEPEIVEYVNEGWTREQLVELFATAKLTPNEALRAKQAPAEELGLATASDDTILDAMLEHPILVNRPIVVTENGVALCRPSEAVFALLNLPSGTTFTKEDGEEIIAP